MKSSGRILDAGALKALAHPLRVRLLDLLVEVGPSTASGLGRLVGENSGSTSYHLRQLARHGLIEEAEGLGTARDRYWRIVDGGWTLDGFGMLQDEDTAPAARFLLDEVQRTRAERMARWHADAPRWGEASRISSGTRPAGPNRRSVSTKAGSVSASSATISRASSSRRARPRTTARHTAGRARPR
jgi:DNA-binding transcriptional ArsR family regulator